MSWRELIDKAGLAITLDISKPNVEHAARANLVSLLLFANHARSQETEPAPTIVTDRPDVTESSIVVPKGSLQFENGITWTTDRSARSVDLTETLVRFGISRRIELRFVIPNYFKDLTGSNASGFACQRIAPLQEVR